MEACPKADPIMPGGPNSRGAGFDKKGLLASPIRMINAPSVSKSAASTRFTSKVSEKKP